MAELQGSFIEANDIKVRYNYAGTTDKPAIVLLHGVTDSGLCWTATSQELVNDYHVVMPDARGHGLSDNIETGFSSEILADDTADVIKKLNLGSCFLYGHSMGAFTAFRVAAKYPKLAKAIVLEDPPFFICPPLSDGQAFASLRQWLLEFKALSPEERYSAAFSANPGWSKAEVVPWVDSKVEFRLEVLEHIGEIQEFPWQTLLPNIECPILLITGNTEKGAVVSEAAAQQATALWKKGQVVHISGAGHSIHRDRFEQTINSVKSFLSLV